MIRYSHKTIIEGGCLPPQRVLKHWLLRAELALALSEFHLDRRTILLFEGADLCDRVLWFIEFIPLLEGVLQQGQVRPTHHQCRCIFFGDLRFYYFRSRCYHWLLGLLSCADLLRQSLEYFRVDAHGRQVLIAFACESHALFMLSLKEYRLRSRFILQ